LVLLIQQIKENFTDKKTSYKPFKPMALHFTCNIIIIHNIHMGERGGTVVKVLCYKSEGR
jgi:hypothetical protein